MKKQIIFLSLAISLLFPAMGSVSRASDAQPAPLLPESLAARAQMAADKKTTTIFIREKDPEKATAQLNASNDDYAQKGWNLFSILPYIHDEEFEGFFITYEKKLILE